MWRQGDVLIDNIDEIPKTAERLRKLVLATGDSTGQRHQIRDGKTAELYQQGGNLFVRVTADEATVSHPEHRPIVLPRGQYRVWKQREFTDTVPRAVRD